MQDWIVLEAAGRSFGAAPNRVEVLKPTHLRIATGELTLIMGPSGSGKTTLLSILGLVLNPDRGRHLLAGEDVTGASEGRRCALRRAHVAFVFQQFNLLESLTARENVMTGLALAGVRGPAAHRRAGEVLERLGMAGRIDALPRDLSGGQKQRVGIARALAMPGRLLLADEPTAALDSTSGEAVMRILHALAREEDRAVVTVTHDARWTRMADRVVRIADGRIESEERTAHVAVA